MTFTVYIISWILAWMFKCTATRRIFWFQNCQYILKGWDKIYGHNKVLLHLLPQVINNLNASSSFCSIATKTITRKNFFSVSALYEKDLLTRSLWVKSLPDKTSETLANFSKDSLTELEVNETSFTAFDVYNTDVCLKVQKCSFKVKEWDSPNCVDCPGSVLLK